MMTIILEASSLDCTDMLFQQEEEKSHVTVGPPNSQEKNGITQDKSQKSTETKQPNAETKSATDIQKHPITQSSAIMGCGAGDIYLGGSRQRPVFMFPWSVSEGGTKWTFWSI